MTKLRKCVCVLLTMALICGICGMGVISSAEDAKYESEVSLLVGLGIMEGAGGGQFNLDKQVTRAEFAAMIFRLLDLDEVAYGAAFRDVTSNHWAYQYIQTVAAQGYIKGDSDGNFRPEESITTEEAVKVLVAVLGYTYPAEEAGGYPAGYLAVGGNIGVLHGVSLAQGKSLTRGEIARMVANSLDIKLMQQYGYGDNPEYGISSDSTILTDYLHITDIRGSVRANHWVNLDGEYELTEEQVVIGDTLYYTGKTDIAQQVGYSVRAYVRLDESDPVQTVLYYTLLPNQNTTVVSSKDISDATTAERFVYTDGNRTREVDIPHDITMIWNGKARFAFDAKTLQPLSGSVTLVMDGGRLSMLRVSSYESRVVQSISESTKSIYYKNNVPPTSLEDSEISYSITKRDRRAWLSDLEENDIVSIAQSEDGMLIDIIVSNETMNGTITMVTDDKYAVDGMSYPVSPYYSGKKLDLGKQGTFYFDIFGEIVYADYTSAGQEYAYLLAKAYRNELTPVLIFKILTMSGKVEERQVAQRAELNDTRADLENIYNTLPVNQLIRVQLSAAGEVQRIWTALDNTAVANPNYDTEEFSKDIANKTMRYNDKLFSDGAELVCAPDSVPVMIVAKNRDNEIEERECGISTVSKTFSSGSTYSDMTFYDMDADTRIPGLIVRVRTVGSSSVNSTNPVCVIDEIYDTIDDDGTPLRGLRYYRDGQIYSTPVHEDVVSTRRNDNSDSRNVPEIFRNVAFDDLQRGDVVQISTNSSGQVSVFRPLFVQKYAPAEHTQLVSNGGSGYSEFPTLETYYGEIVRRNTQIITMRAGSASTSYVCTRPKVYHLDRARDRLEVLEPDDLAAWIGNGDAFVHASRKNCQVIVVYD